jgi:hypothetical protein
MRERLPDRRGALAVSFEHGGRKYRAHVGFFAPGRRAECFVDSDKPNSSIDAFAADSAILISLLLQRGSTVAVIAHSLRRAPDGTPASLIGAVIDELTALEATRRKMTMTSRHFTILRAKRSIWRCANLVAHLEYGGWVQ